MVKIERAGMDGSDRRAVVNSSLGWPGGVAVDAIAERVYWADERLGAIGSATLDGNDIRVKQFGEGDAPNPKPASTLTRPNFYFCPRSCRQQRLPTRSPWRSSMTCSTGPTPKNEWCAALARSLGRRATFC